MFSGCLKPYHEKLMVDIGTSEVAFLIETVNENGQASIAPPSKGEAIDNGEVVQSEFYKNRLVNARKIEIPYYWKQTHRVYFYDSATNGEWQPAARLIVVDTQPEVREWSADPNIGTSNKKEGIWAESNDSVGFSTGVSVTARIDNQDDAILFLSNYPPKSSREIQTKGGVPFKTEIASLEQIMDREVRNKIQEVFSDECSEYDMDELREQKREIIDKIREVVIPYFKERGITIVSIGMFGGFTYENPEIQKSIDAVFQKQQDKQVAQAELEAAKIRKDALKEEGEGEAAKVLEVKRGESEGIKIVAEAEAQAIQVVADAKKYEIDKAAENSETYLELKRIELERERLEKWDGKYPTFLMTGDGQLPQILMEMPQ